MSAHLKTLTVIAPVYNEANIIADFYNALKKELLLEKEYNATILLVVDPGKDNTITVLKKLSANDARLQVITLSRRFGHQSSLIAGLDYASSDLVVMLDADLQHPPEVIHDLLRGFEAGFDMVQTVRLKTENIGVLKNMSSRLYYFLINKLSDTPVRPAAADFRLMSRRLVDVIRTNFKERNMFLRGVIGWIGYRTKYVEFRAPNRSAGESKYTFIRLLRLGLAGVVAFSRKPLRLAFSFGLALFLFGIIGGLVLVVILPSWFSVLAALVAIIGGIQLLFLGVIGEYIGAVFDEVKARPLYLVDAK